MSEYKGSDPRVIHLLDQITGETRTVAQTLGAYRRQLLEEGFPEAEVWALVQKLELRLMGPVFDDGQEDLKSY